MPHTAPSVNGLPPQNCGYVAISGPSSLTRASSPAPGQNEWKRSSTTAPSASVTTTCTNFDSPFQSFSTDEGSGYWVIEFPDRTICHTETGVS